VVSLTPRLLYPYGKIPWYPLDMRLGVHKINETFQSTSNSLILEEKSGF
jgi:hypothetical protein